jgi:hypothetical protein
VGKEPVAAGRKEKEKDGQPRWPFDPMQPGDHEPVRAPEDLEQRQESGRGEKGSNER